MKTKNSNKPRFSLIIPMKNAEEYILTALTSISNQNYDDIEILVIDDNSRTTDASKTIVTNFQKQHPNLTIKSFETSENKRGAGGARNVGLDHATGKYILFLDADDILNEGALASIEKSTLENPTTDIFILGYQMTRLNTNEKPLNTMKFKAGKLQESRFYQIGVNTAGTIWNTCTKNSLYNSHNKIRFKENCIFEDLPTKVQLFTRTKRKLKSVPCMTHTQFSRLCKSITGNLTFKDMGRLISANKEIANLKPSVDKKDKMYINVRMALVPAILSWFISKSIHNKIDRLRNKQDTELFH